MGGTNEPLVLHVLLILLYTSINETMMTVTNFDVIFDIFNVQSYLYLYKKALTKIKQPNGTTTTTTTKHVELEICAVRKALMSCTRNSDSNAEGMCLKGKVRSMLIFCCNMLKNPYVLTQYRILIKYISACVQTYKFGCNASFNRYRE